MTEQAHERSPIWPSWQWWRRTVAIYAVAAVGAGVAFVVGAWVWSLVP